MVGRPKSQDLARKLASDFKAKWEAIAVKRYLAELEKKEPRGLRTIIAEVQAECFEQTRVSVPLARSSVQNRANGMQSLREFNAKKQWLTPEEEDQIVTFAIETARRGFPLTNRHLKEYADAICQARYGQDFPEDGVGKQWTHGFLLRAHDKLSGYWSHSLDHSRARAVNPETKKTYFKLLKEALYGEQGGQLLDAELIYGVDESGFQQGVGVKERVIGPARAGIQYQQRSGGRENITVVVTICADGTALPPAVLFKGVGFQVSWKQDNPLNAL